MIAWIGYGIAAVAAIIALDQLGFWMERRGWIYYRKSKHHGHSSMGNALHQMHSFFDPSIEPPLEEREEAEDRQWDGEKE